MYRIDFSSKRLFVLPLLLATGAETAKAEFPELIQFQSLVAADLGTGRGPRIISGDCADFGVPTEPTFHGGYYCWIDSMLDAFTSPGGYDCSTHSITCIHPEPVSQQMGGTCVLGPDECQDDVVQVAGSEAAVEVPDFAGASEVSLTHPLQSIASPTAYPPETFE